MCSAMARPAGHKLNRPAWDDLLVIRRKSLTEVAKDAGIPRVTLSSILHEHHGASPQVAGRIADALECRVGTLFPSLAPKNDAEAAA